MSYGQFYFNKVGTIQKKGSVSYSKGQKNSTWTNEYTNVRLKELPALRSAMKLEENQPVSTLNKSWELMEEDRSITADMKLVVDSVDHYINGVRPHPKHRRNIILDTTTKDN